MTTTRLASPLSLAKGALTDLRQGWKRYLWILAIITVPHSIVTLDEEAAVNPAISAYSLIALLIMNGALLWAALHQEKTGQVPTARAAYYDGSAIMIRLLVVAILLVLMMLPLIFGIAIYLVGASAANGVGIEQLLIGLVGLLIALPSFVWAIRFGLAPLVAADTDLRPVAALRAARELTIGRFWRVAYRYLGLLAFIIVTSIPVAAIAAGLGFLQLGGVAMFLFGLITTFIALPLFNLYLLRLYRDLQVIKAPFKPKKSENSESDVI